MLLSPLTPVVNAYTETYTLPHGNEVNPENKVIRALNNKYIYATGNPSGGTTGLDIAIFSSLGAYITTSTRTADQIKTDLGTTYAQHAINDISLFNIDSTTVGIFVTIRTYSTTGTPDYKTYVIGYWTINVNTGVITYRAKYTPPTVTVSSPSYLSNVLTVSSNFFIVSCRIDYVTGLSYMVMHKLTSTAISSNTVYETTSDGAIPHKIVIGYDNLGSIYVLTSFKATNTPRLFQFIISTSAFNNVGESSMSGIWVDKASTSMNNIKFAGFEYMPYEDFYYLSFNYVYAYISGTDLFYRCFSFRMIYNSSVTLGNLIAQNHRYYNIEPFGYSYGAGVGVAKLYYRNDYNSFEFYYQRIVGGFYYWSKDNLIIGDYYSTTSSNLLPSGSGYVQDVSLEGEEIPIDTVRFGIEQVVRQPEQNVQFNLGTWVLTDGKVYLVSPLQTSYDLTFSVAPVDTPLILNKKYTFTVTAYQGGAPFSGMLYLYANNVLFGMSETNIVGGVSFDKTFSIGGYWNLTAIIMVAGNNVYEESHLYTVSFTQGEEGTPETVATGNLDMVASYLIPSIALLFPVGIGIAALHQHPEIGLMVGLTIGGLIAVWSQLVPMYVLIIIVIIDILIIFYGRNSGDSGGL